jgi:hypothetical protein
MGVCVWCVCVVVWDVLPAVYRRGGREGAREGGREGLLVQVHTCKVTVSPAVHEHLVGGMGM